MPRMPELDKQFIENFLPAGGALNPLDLARRWQLTNTRYILGVQSLVPILNQAFDPVAKRFSVRIPFSIVPKPDIQSDADLAKGDILDNLTAVPTTNGPLALIEFSGALPRAKLYSQWETPASDAQSLQRLKDGAFDPMQKVLVSESIGASTANLGPAGTATILKYQAKKVVIQCQASSPSVLLLNDRWNPDWEVIVDHRKAKLLRANFIMRGVEIPAGQHEVEFYYNPPHNTLYVSVASLAFAIGLVSWLCFAGPKCADRH